MGERRDNKLVNDIDLLLTSFAITLKDRDEETEAKQIVNSVLRKVQIDDERHYWRMALNISLFLFSLLVCGIGGKC